MTVAAHQHVAINGIKDVVQTIGVVFAVIIGMEAEAHKPTALLLGPLAEPYQLDRLASRCSRKSLNLLKHSVRDCGCALQYATVAIFSAFTFLW